MSIEQYRELFEYEIDCNAKMLTMLHSVPADKRTDPLFQRAVKLAAHLAACRENWLKWMARTDDSEAEWFEVNADLNTLQSRYSAFEEKWTQYLAGLNEDGIHSNFSVTESDGSVYTFPVMLQTMQLALHAPYHRGQIALLVDLLGGETVDTDYVDWVYKRDPSQFEVG